MLATKAGRAAQDAENLPVKQPQSISPERLRAPLANSQDSHKDSGHNACLPLQPAATGWPQLGPESAQGVGPTALKWAAQHRRSMSIIPDPNTVVIREDETAKQQQTPWNAWLEHGEREDSLHGGSDDQPANEAVPNAQDSMSQSRLSPKEPSEADASASPNDNDRADSTMDPLSLAKSAVTPAKSSNTVNYALGSSEQGAPLTSWTAPKVPLRHSSLPASTAGPERSDNLAWQSRSESGDYRGGIRVPEGSVFPGQEGMDAVTELPMMTHSGLPMGHGRKSSMKGPVYMRPAGNARLPSADFDALNLHEYFSPLSAGLRDPLDHPGPTPLHHPAGAASSTSGHPLAAAAVTSTVATLLEDADRSAKSSSVHHSTDSEPFQQESQWQGGEGPPPLPTHLKRASLSQKISEDCVLPEDRDNPEIFLETQPRYSAAGVRHWNSPAVDSLSDQADVAAMQHSAKPSEADHSQNLSHEQARLAAAVGIAGDAQLKAMHKPKQSRSYTPLSDSLAYPRTHKGLTEYSQADFQTSDLGQIPPEPRSTATKQPRFVPLISMSKRAAALKQEQSIDYSPLRQSIPGVGLSGVYPAEGTARSFHGPPKRPPALQLLQQPGVLDDSEPPAQKEPAPEVRRDSKSPVQQSAAEDFSAAGLLANQPRGTDVIFSGSELPLPNPKSNRSSEKLQLKSELDDGLQAGAATRKSAGHRFLSSISSFWPGTRSSSAVSSPKASIAQGFERGADGGASPEEETAASQCARNLPETAVTIQNRTGFAGDALVTISAAPLKISEGPGASSLRPIADKTDLSKQHSKPIPEEEGARSIKEVSSAAEGNSNEPTGPSSAPNLTLPAPSQAEGMQKGSAAPTAPPPPAFSKRETFRPGNCQASRGFGAISSHDLSMGRLQLKAVPDRLPALLAAGDTNFDDQQKCQQDAVAPELFDSSEDLASAPAGLKQASKKSQAGTSAQGFAKHSPKASSGLGNAFQSFLKRAQDIRASFYSENTTGRKDASETRKS